MYFKYNTPIMEFDSSLNNVFSDATTVSLVSYSCLLHTWVSISHASSISVTVLISLRFQTAVL